MQETPEVQRELRSLLQKIWSVFRNVETVNPHEIVATLATLMTEGKTSAFPEEIRPCKPRNRYNVDADIMPLLEQAYEKIDAATFFDRYILFYDQLLKEGDSAYPIPRHIADFIIQLLRVESQHTFADFTCGTGGFLVNPYRGENLRQGDAVGIEISPDWIRLAVANAILHDIPPDHLQFYIGNALRICSTNPKLKSRKFDRIVLAPPFGETIDEELIRLWREERKGGSSSEDVFTRMVLQKLAGDGWAALMVPASFTSKVTSGMPRLRSLLVHDYTLHAVISLPDNVLVPFADHQPVCLLLLTNESPYSEHPVWFFRARKDGYPAGLNRDLLVAPDLTPEGNDLFLIEQSLRQNDLALRRITTDMMSDTGIAFAQVLRQNGETSEMHGTVIRIAERATLHTIRLFSHTEKGVQHYEALMIVSWQEQKQDAVGYIFLPLSREIPDPGSVSTFTQRDDADNYVRNIYGLKGKEDFPKSVLISQERLSGQMIVLAHDGYITGITQPQTLLMEGEHVLQPEHYFPLAEELFSTDSPVTLLSKIQQDQALIEHYVENLLGQLEINAIDSSKLPPPIDPENPEDSQTKNLLINALGSIQRIIWNLIYQHMQTKSQANEKERYAFYFLPDQLLNKNELRDAEIDRLQLQQTLDLFVRMGLLVRVFVTPPERKERFVCYRLAIGSDTIDLPERLNA